MPRLLVVCAFVFLSGCKTIDGTGTAEVSGMLMGPPLGWTSSAAPAGGPPTGTIEVKGPGFTPGPVVPPPTGVPAVDFGAFVSALVSGLPLAAGFKAAAPPLAAMSLGIDIIATDEVSITNANVASGSGWLNADYPLLRVGNHGWYAVGFTVDGALIEVGDDLADPIKDPVGRDSSVFCYVLPASSTSVGGQYLLPDELESTKVLEPDDLGITAADDLHAINMHIGLYQTDLATAANYSQRKLPTDPNLFYVLRQEFIDSVDINALATRLQTTTDKVTTGTIFVSHWKAGQWSHQGVFRTAAQLEIDDPATAVFDGLAIDTLNSKGIQILYSLRHSTSRTVPPDDQIMHVALATSASAPSKPPRRVVIAIDGRYGSLGGHMRAGRAIGDFCTADPWLPDPDFKHYVPQAPKIPEDFEFARRKPNPGVGPKWVVLPIAAMRAWSGRQAVVRVCMATPRRLLAKFGGHASLVPGKRPKATAKLYWGHTDDVTQGAVKGDWQLVGEWPLPDEPFHRDFRLVPDSAPEPTHTVRGIVARWELHADGRIWHSPVSALRY